MLTGPELGAAIRKAIDLKGVSQAAVAAHFGVKPPSVIGWMNRGTISKDKLPDLWAYFSDVVGPEHWGLNSGVAGLVDVLSPPPTQSQSQHQVQEARNGYADQSTDYVQVPHVRFKLAAGAHGFAVDYLQGEREPLWFRRAWFKAKGLNPRKVFACDVTGPSMQPGLNEGDTVLVNTLATEPRDGKVFAALYEGEMVVKRLRRNAGEWWLASDNPDQVRHAPKVCDASCKLVGEVVHKQSETI